VVHVERSRSGRHVACIGVVEDGAHGLEVSAAVAVQAGTVSLGPAWPGLARRLGLDDSGHEDGGVEPAVGGSRPRGPVPGASE
jgi:pilus assembly protein CpaF